MDQTPDWKLLVSHFRKEGRISKADCLQIIRRTAALTSCDPNTIRLEDPVTVVGDIHGQFYDFVKLLEVGGDADVTKYLFLGDYVDRGSFAIEVVLVLFCLKLAHPKHIHLLRGNHECRQMTAFFNFRDECEHKFDLQVYNAFMDCFDTLSISALINTRFFCVHGGISPALPKRDDVGHINRFQEPPRAGGFCDILWADPADELKETHLAHTEPFFPNDVRGCSYFFTFAAAKSFIEHNKLLSIVRAHEAQLEGYKMHALHPVNRFPTVITIFSAPNYCDIYNNKGAVLKFDNNTLNIQQYNFTPHPYCLPNFIDIFMWSIPFVADKVGEIMEHILFPTIEEREGEVDVEVLELTGETADAINYLTDRTNTVHVPVALEVTTYITHRRAEGIRRKVLAVGRLLFMLQILRDASSQVEQLKSVLSGKRLPLGVLLSGTSGIQKELDKLTGVANEDLKMVDISLAV